jgi:hypothetical protein
MAFDWKSIVGTVAPTIATALGGPLAGLATKAIMGAVGLGDGATDAEIAKAVVGASPEQLLALKRADLDFAVKMRELDVDLERIASSDRDSARRRESVVKDMAPKVLAAVIVLGFLATVFMVLGGQVEGLKDPLTATVVGTLIGYVSAKADQVVSYYFGSSASSAKKDDTIKSLSA